MHLVHAMQRDLSWVSHKYLNEVVIPIMFFLYVTFLLPLAESIDMTNFPRVPKPEYRIETEKCVSVNTTVNNNIFAEHCGSEMPYPYVELWNCSYFCCVAYEMSDLNVIRLNNVLDFNSCGNDIYVATNVRDLRDKASFTVIFHYVH